jgi:hypothetical protein
MSVGVVKLDRLWLVVGACVVFLQSRLLGFVSAAFSKKILTSIGDNSGKPPLLVARTRHSSGLVMAVEVDQSRAPFCHP